jgi:hypothetical protein
MMTHEEFGSMGALEIFKRIKCCVLRHGDLLNAI